MEGQHKDEGKPRFDLIPVAPLTEIAKVLTEGANKKYSDNNWALGVNYSRYYSSLQRHLNAFWGGKGTDPEFGLHHLAHAGCCLLFLLYYELNRKKYEAFDDRLEKEKL